MASRVLLNREEFPAPEEVNWRTLTDVLIDRSRGRQGSEAFRFLNQEGEPDDRMTYGELDRQARAIAAALKKLDANGERVLLLYPPGLLFITALFGCFYSGAVAVPAYPPDLASIERTLLRLEDVAEDADVKLVLTTAVVQEMVKMMLAKTPRLRNRFWIATDDRLNGAESDWKEPNIERNSMAVLQYTSGSTRNPRGVILTHGNLLNNLAFICRAFGHSDRSQGVIWLPPYHDMGLIGGILQPVYAGFPCALMSPLTFFQRPLRWLRAISKCRATTSGGPNFAYDLCVRRIRAEQCEGLDLSSWDLAFNGSEPVRAETIDRFATAFQPYGFRREAFYPCYGLAEATLAVTGGSKASQPNVLAFTCKGLEDKRAVPVVAGSKETSVHVGCGCPSPDHHLAIVDPQTLEPLPPDRVGEICLSGPSVAAGYWKRPDETKETFRVSIKGRSALFMRSGDLGFVHGGELFVTGRIKDMLVVRGRNYYPQDLELCAERGHEALRRDCGAAFIVEKEGNQRLVIVAEIKGRRVDYEAAVRGIRTAISTGVGLQVQAIALVKPGNLPKTTSGKIQRQLCRSRYLKGELETVATWSLDGV
jgi:acyl-CoA synthetase (AMP-forming)/AMP-acid ligase II